MLLIAGAVVAGILLGFALGGNLKDLADAHFRWWGLAVIGLALQFVPVPGSASSAHHLLGVGLLMGSYALLIAFVLANVRYVGFWVVAAGFALNLLVIGVNGGMPVSDQALRSAYGPGYAATLHQLESSGGAKHHLRRPDDDLTAISDNIPIGTPVHNVFSLGDLVALVGVGWVMAQATAGGKGRHLTEAGRVVHGAGEETGWFRRRAKVATVPVPDYQPGEAPPPGPPG
jgi:hypothetical protein